MSANIKLTSIDHPVVDEVKVLYESIDACEQENLMTLK